MQDLINEIRKLIEYAGPNGKIEKSDVDKLTIKKLESVIFDLTDSLGKKEIGKALEVLKNLIYAKEPIQKILITLYNHFKKLYFVKLSLKYNLLAVDRFLTSFFRKIYFDTYGPNTKSYEIHEAELKPVILHSTSLFEIKPWDSNIHPDYELFTKYLNMVNPEFQSDELTMWQKFFSQNPILLKSLIVAHSFTPKSIQPLARKLAVKVTKR